MINDTEYHELVALIGVCDVVGCYGVNDIRRRAQLEARATESQLKSAWKANGLTTGEFEEVFI